MFLGLWGRYKVTWVTQWKRRIVCEVNLHDGKNLPKPLPHLVNRSTSWSLSRRSGGPNGTDVYWIEQLRKVLFALEAGGARFGCIGFPLLLNVGSALLTLSMSLFLICKHETSRRQTSVFKRNPTDWVLSNYWNYVGHHGRFSISSKFWSYCSDRTPSFTVNSTFDAYIWRGQALSSS